MKFGVFYEHQLPKPWNKRSEKKLFDESLDQAELADKLGFDFVWAVEHHFLEEYSHSSSPEIFLAACSQRTEQIRLGHGIVLMLPAYNHPVRVAERLSTLDIISGGRVEWGTGKSSSSVELGGFGLNPFDKDTLDLMWHESVREVSKMLKSTPYPGFKGKTFSVPVRNIVPKPIQTPHPPLWMACTSRESIVKAARLGVGALTFAFTEPDNAKFWVEEYYETFERECHPIGQAVNPNIAMTVGLSCHRNAQTDSECVSQGFRFFGHALSHYYAHGSHEPGNSNIWGEYVNDVKGEQFPDYCVGTPDKILENLKKYEESGVDQVIFLQQAGKIDHERICNSMQLFSEEVMPYFKLNIDAKENKKRQRLDLAVKKALARIETIQDSSHVRVDSTPLMMKKNNIAMPESKHETFVGVVSGTENSSHIQTYKNTKK